MIVAITILVLVATAAAFVHFPQSWAMFSWLRSSSPARLSPADAGDHKTKSAKKSASPIPDATLESSPNATPKVKAHNENGAVPSFTLAGGQDSDKEEEDNLPPPQFPALNSAQRAAAPSLSPYSGTPEPLNGTVSSGLMPPPVRPAVPRTQSATVRSSTNTLRIPPTGPLPSRAATSSSTLSLPSTAPPTRSRKVELAPGHSPLDWANLTRTHPNLAGTDPPGKLLLVTPSMLRANNGRRGSPAWSSFRGKVYNMTPYLPFHPGGVGEIRRAAGKDGEKLFNEVHPWVNWDNMLSQCVVGILVSESAGAGNPEMDAID